MEQDSDNSNSDPSGTAAVESEVGSDVSLLEERVRALVAEKDHLVTDLAQAKLAVEASERELAGSRQKIQELTTERDQLVGSQTQSQSAVAASERQLAAMHAKIQELNSEKVQLAGQIAQARSAIATGERELAAAMSQVQELTKEREGLVAEAQAQANILRDKLRAFDGESVFSFIRRRYFSQK
jgi:chromosome segregation ATPase